MSCSHFPNWQLLLIRASCKYNHTLMVQYLSHCTFIQSSTISVNKPPKFKIYILSLPVGFIHIFSSLPAFLHSISAWAKDCALSSSLYEPSKRAPPRCLVESPNYVQNRKNSAALLTSWCYNDHLYSPLLCVYSRAMGLSLTGNYCLTVSKIIIIIIIIIYFFLFNWFYIHISYLILKLAW